MRKIRAKYLRISEETNALDFLNEFYRHIKRTETDIYAWKWVILSLHSALYSFAICTLKGTNSDRVTTTTKSGKERLIDFNEAMKRCQDPNWMHMLIGSKHLQLTNSQKDSIKLLNSAFRNNFEHYIPKLWSIEVHGFPLIVLDILEVVEFLALDTGNYLHWKNSEKRKIKSILFQSRKYILHSRLYKEAIIASVKFAT